MFKKFNHNLNRSPVGAIWGISVAVVLSIGVIQFPLGDPIIPIYQIVIALLSMSMIFNFAISTYILITGEIKQVNVYRVCPTARQYMSEKEIEKIEKEGK